eukprot:gb/GECH01006864.1/.p1 GENE.gb/GECH01006864.1/~~gb/GECH01006864.1/.p1  ORF type:complete len:896 (+),score=184.92 gb/GECH01006864.1/:1-2688(+)
MPELKGKNNNILSDSSNDDDLESCCPLCCEEFDETDKSLVPCPCGYQICVWCLNEILQRDTLGGRCPACRREYQEENLVPQQPLNSEPKKKKRKKNKQNSNNQNPQQQNRKDLTNVRVIQRNLVYVVGLPWEYAEEDLLRENPYFGQYGTIRKIVVNKSNPHANHSNTSYTVSAYVTYAHREEALSAIECVDGAWLDGRMLRASFGTTKYCSYFLRGVPCNNQECMYLHDFGDENDTFTKEDMVNCKAEFQKQIHPINNPPQEPIDIEGLPPPTSSESEEEEPQNEQDDSSAPITVTSNPAKSSLDSSKVSLLPSNAMWGSQNKQKKQDTDSILTQNQSKSKKEQSKSKSKKKSKKEKKTKSDKQTSSNESQPDTSEQNNKEITNQIPTITSRSSISSSPTSSYRSDEDSQILSATSSEADPGSVGQSPSLEPIGSERKPNNSINIGSAAPGAPIQSSSLSKEMGQLNLGPSATNSSQQQVPSFNQSWEKRPTQLYHTDEENSWKQSPLFSAFQNSNSEFSNSLENQKSRADFDLASFIQSELKSDQEDHTDKEIENTVISSLFKQKRNQSRFFSGQNDSNKPSSTYRPNQSFAPIKAGEKEFLINHFLGQEQTQQKPMQANVSNQNHLPMFSGHPQSQSQNYLPNQPQPQPQSQLQFQPQYQPHPQSHSQPHFRQSHLQPQPPQPSHPQPQPRPSVPQNLANQQQHVPSFSTPAGYSSSVFGSAAQGNFSTNSAMWSNSTGGSQGFPPQSHIPPNPSQPPMNSYQPNVSMNPANPPFAQSFQMQNSNSSNTSWSTPSTLLSLLSKSNTPNQLSEQQFGSNHHNMPSAGQNRQNFITPNGSAYWDSAIVGTGASYAVPEGNGAQEWMRPGPYSTQVCLISFIYVYDLYHLIYFIC